MSVYFPSGRWYDVITQSVISENGKETKTLDTPLDQIQVHSFALLLLCFRPLSRTNIGLTCLSNM